MLDYSILHTKRLKISFKECGYLLELYASVSL